MNDDFLSYFNRELSYLKNQGEMFSKLHPKAAGKLGLSEGVTQDPNVLRLIQAFAFLSARIHRKLDDDFSEIAQALLNVLYPQHLLPIPSFSIVQFSCSSDASKEVLIPKHSELETQNKPYCQFKTCYDLSLYPTEIHEIKFSNTIDGLLEEVSSPMNVLSNLTISIKTLKDQSFESLSPSRLLFYINLPAPYCFYVHEMILKNTVQVSFWSENSQQIKTSDLSCIHTKGFSEKDRLLPYPPNALLSYGLLTEFFSFTEKFMFFEVELPDLKRFNKDLNITFYFDSYMEELHGILSKNSFSLGCTPIINLFEKKAEPILLDHTKTDYLIIPDARRAEYLDIYNIQAVRSVSHITGETQPCYPLYGLKHHEDTQKDDNIIFWQASRRELMGSKTEEQEVFLSFVDSGLNPSEVDEKSIQVDLLCTNHLLPYTLPFGNKEPALRLLKEKAISSVVCLLPFTPSYRFPLSTGLCWQLISHISLNNFSLIEKKEHLQELLSLYNVSESENNALLIRCIQEITSTFKMARQNSRGYTGFVGGKSIQIKMEGSSPHMFLFAMVLEHFLSSLCPMNSFTELSVLYKNSKRKGEWKWPHKSGKKYLL
jgi:type VI secretion system protein ImpG